jgi:TPR repeat protein
MSITPLFLTNLIIILLFSLMSHASSANDAKTEYHLGEQYRLGDGVAINVLKAESHYINAAQKNHPLAQLNLGKMYYFGKLGPNQKEKAFYWFDKSAQQNNADAQWMLGGMLFNGQVINQDIAAAYSWFTLASEQDHVQAIVNKTQIKKELSTQQLSLADTLTSAFKQQQAGKLMVRQQEEKAFNWLHQAAKQNDPYSQWMIGNMLLKGQGVPQDNIAAYSWITLASEQDYSQASLKQMELEIEMTTEQLSLADSLTSAFKQQRLTFDAKQQQPEIIKATAQQPTVRPSLSLQSNVMKHRYRVQVGSFKARQTAEIGVAELTEKLPSIMSMQISTIIHSKASSNKAGFYRLQLGAFSDKQDANRLCEQLAKHHQACFVVKEKIQ